MILQEGGYREQDADGKGLEDGKRWGVGRLDEAICVIFFFK